MKEIQLTKGKVALVDDEDYERLSKWKWQYRAGYAARAVKVNRRSALVLMHRLIMNTPSGMETDHKDSNPLNNQKDNLRVCTRSQNMMNRKKYLNGSSAFKGVWVRRQGERKCYQARIRIEGKSITKAFPYTPEGEIQAAKTYNEMAMKYFGEFAKLNNV